MPLARVAFAASGTAGFWRCPGHGGGIQTDIVAVKEKRLCARCPPNDWDAAQPRFYCEKVGSTGRTNAIASVRSGAEQMGVSPPSWLGVSPTDLECQTRVRSYMMRSLRKGKRWDTGDRARLKVRAQVMQTPGR